MQTLLHFLYNMEKDPLGVKIESFDLSTRDDNGRQPDARPEPERADSARDDAMKSLASILFSLLLAAGAVTAVAQETNSADGLDFKSFDIIARKIFLTNRATGLRSLEGRRAVSRGLSASLLGIKRRPRAPVRPILEARRIRPVSQDRRSFRWL